MYTVNATLEMNKDMYTDLNNRISRKHLRLLVDEVGADDVFSKNKKYPEWRSTKTDIYKKIIKPYKETTSLINEMISLEIVDKEKVRLKEKSGNTKDRFSSLAMGNYFISTLEKKLFEKKTFDWGQYCASAKSRGYKNA